MPWPHMFGVIAFDEAVDSLQVLMCVAMGLPLTDAGCRGHRVEEISR